MKGRHQSGFTLVELSVVTAVIAVLAAIAVPRYAGYKSKGVDASMQSALHEARTAIEAFSVKNGDSYAGATVADLEHYGYPPAANVTIQIDHASVSAYTVRACTVGGTVPSFVYDSRVGKQVEDSSDCGS